MKRITVAVCSTALLIVGCGGSSHHGSTPQERQEAQRVQRIVDKCLPTNPVSLRSHAVRQKFVHCTVPPKNVGPASTCLRNVFLRGVPRKARIEHGVVACVNKYA